MEKISLLLIAVAIICTVITVITQFTKELGFLKKIPTSLQVLITSIIVCEVFLFGVLSYYNIVFVWYYPVAILFVAFLIAYICMFGWEKLIEMFKRFWKKEGDF